MYTTYEKLIGNRTETLKAMERLPNTPPNTEIDNYILFKCESVYQIGQALVYSKTGKWLEPVSEDSIDYETLNYLDSIAMETLGTGNFLLVSMGRGTRYLMIDRRTAK